MSLSVDDAKVKEFILIPSLWEIWLQLDESISVSDNVIQKSIYELLCFLHMYFNTTLNPGL
jgi:hypothetical protein